MSSTRQPAHERRLAQGCPFNVIHQLHVHPGLHHSRRSEGASDRGADPLYGGSGSETGQEHAQPGGFLDDLPSSDGGLVQ